MGRGATSIQPRWPATSYRRVPPYELAERAAADLRRRAGLGHSEPLVDLNPVLAAGNFKLARADLRAADGGLEAMMFPGSNGTLSIRVDPTPCGGWGSASDPLIGEISRQRERFRVAHEIGHALFYDTSSQRRRRLRRSSPGEEAFCDRFAAALLMPPLAVREMPVAAASAIALQRRFQVSLEVALRALVSANPGAKAVLAYWREAECSDLSIQWGTDAELAQRALGSDRCPCWTEARPPEPRQQLVLVRSPHESCSASCL